MTAQVLEVAFDMCIETWCMCFDNCSKMLYTRERERVCPLSHFNVDPLIFAHFVTNF